MAVHGGGRWLAVLVVACAPFVGGGEATAQSELRQVFEDLMRDPTNPELNMRYARKAEEEGQQRKALAAYERVLMNDPDNVEAQEQIARIKREMAPEFTDVTVVLGADYESNARQRRNGDDLDDFVFGGRVTMRDERKLGDTRLRTNGNLFANWHARHGQLDFGLVSADTGPVLPLAGKWSVRPGIGARYAWLDGHTLLSGGTLHLNFENDATETLQRVDVRAGYDVIGREFSDRDAYYFELSPRLVWRETLANGDFVSLRPKYRFNGGGGDEPDDRFTQRDIFPERYHQVGARADYFVPLTDWAFGGVNFAAHYRDFHSTVPGGNDGRHDTYIAPGAMIVFPDALMREHDLMMNYTYEQNVSNDGVENYQNHIVGVRSIWRF